MNSERYNPPPVAAAFETVRRQMVMVCPSSATTTAGSTAQIPTLELRIAGAMVYRKFHLAVLPVSWRYNANDGFEILVEWLVNDQPSSSMRYYYGRDGSNVAYPFNGFVELQNSGMSFLPAFGFVRQENHKLDFAESTLDPLDLMRLSGSLPTPAPDSLFWAYQNGVLDNSGAYLIVTPPQKLVSDANKIRLTIRPVNVEPWAMNSDGLTDNLLQVPFFVCMGCVSTSLPY